jgi:asparagine synthase (glutamine-hydrolysing)
MCGIAGVVRADPRGPVDALTLRRMARALRHRGPDGFGLASGAGAGLVSTRLAIIDPESAWQPMRGPAGTVLVYNGEVFDHPELRAELERDGATVRGGGDTEVVLRLLERDGVAALGRLNGQFALAWWSPARRRLVLARDRFGIAPLHVAAAADGSLAFASEAKALIAARLVSPSLDLRGLDDVLGLWGPQAPRTTLAGVRQLVPGGLLIWEDGSVVHDGVWTGDAPAAPAPAPERDLEELLRDSVRLRLRADVPVGAYLSGGLDSSLVCALAQQETEHRLRTFSVAFADPRFDERPHQLQVAAALNTEHHVVEVGGADIAAALPEVVRHAETPLVRTAPVPLWLLSRAVREAGITVVATGEGADEAFWGYDLLKEVALRDLHRREPARAERLLDELYPYVGDGTAGRGAAWRRALLGGAAPGDPVGSHRTRLAAGSAARALYAPEVAAELAGEDALDRVAATLPPGFAQRDALDRAAHLELTTLLPGYLLAAQGDRVAHAHGVEPRFPFLDHRVVAHAHGLPPERKLDGDLRDKVALRDVAARLLPADVAARPKLPYRAPAAEPFFGPAAPPWVAELLAPAAVAEVGIFDARRVPTLVRRCAEGRARGTREGMALVAILSTQLWHHAFCAPAAGPALAETAVPRVELDLDVDPRLEEVA